MKRVLMTSDAVGGVWTYTVELVRALAAHGIEVTVAAMGPAPTPDQRADFAPLQNARLVHQPFALEWMENVWPNVDAAGNWLLGLAASFAPDVIHLSGYVHATLKWKAPVVVVAHSCVRTWWKSVHGEQAPARFAEYRRRVLAGVLAADAVVTPTRAFRDALEAEYHLHLPGATIHNAHAVSGSGSGAKEPRIFSAGRIWDEAKNIALLARIAPQLQWPVRVAGDTREKDVVGVELVGKLSKAGVAEELGRAAIYAAPARYEPFGLSILEAAASSCALVLSDLPTLRELWDGCAFFVPVDDDAAWIAALDLLTRNAAMRETLQARAQERAREFSPATQAAAYARLYSRLTRVAFPVAA